MGAAGSSHRHEKQIGHQCLRPSLKDLAVATNGFSSKRVLGRGGSSTVYRGVLNDGTMVAVKVFELIGRQSFLTELKFMSELRHRNILKLLGYVSDGNTMALLFPLMANGSLQEPISKHASCSFSWDRRYQIALGIAKGLAYLHHDMQQALVHGDIKPSNILLDDELEAHIADFGCACLESQIPTSPAWSTGYAAPEVANRGVLSTKADVYSYGILLLELLTGKSPTALVFCNGLDIILWVQKALADGSLESILDPRLQQSVPLLQVTSVLKLAIACTQACPTDRPAMTDILDLIVEFGSGYRCEQMMAIPREILVRDIYSHQTRSFPDTETSAE